MRVMGSGNMGNEYCGEAGKDDNPLGSSYSSISLVANDRSGSDRQ